MFIEDVKGCVSASVRSVFMDGTTWSFITLRFSRQWASIEDWLSHVKDEWSFQTVSIQK